MLFETILIVIASVLVLGLLGYYRYKSVQEMGKKMANDYRSAFDKSKERH